MIFVFGSNEAGIHGAGAAAYAHKSEGAVWGVGLGLEGNSYAIPTKDDLILSLPLQKIHEYVVGFLDNAEAMSEVEFQVTRIGCGLAGFKDAEIAPLFADAPSNCYFDTAWKPYLPATAKFWGTF